MPHPRLMAVEIPSPASPAAREAAEACFTLAFASRWGCGSLEHFTTFLDSTWEATLCGDLKSAVNTSWAGTVLQLPLFVDDSRRRFINMLFPKLLHLAAGRLCGQRACYLLQGARGLGKSTFVHVLAAAAAAHAPPSMLIIYVNWKSAPVRSIAATIIQALSERSPPLEGVPVAGSGLDAVHKYLRDQALSVFNQARSVAEEDLKVEIGRELHNIGDYSGSSKFPRRIMVVATGSTAVLRKLAFAMDGYDALKEPYNLSRVIPNLNDTKFIAHTLRPVFTAGDVTAARLACAHSNATFRDTACSGGLLLVSADGAQ